MTLDDREKLRRAIELSGLSQRQFAFDVLMRDDSTVRRWLSGASPIPKQVKLRLDDWLKGEAV